jgi:hypothetical protein
MQKLSLNECRTVRLSALFFGSAAALSVLLRSTRNVIEIPHSGHRKLQKRLAQEEGGSARTTSVVCPTCPV